MSPPSVGAGDRSQCSTREKRKGKRWHLMVSRNRMMLYLEQTAMAELGVRGDVSRWNHHGGRYARVEEHLGHLVGWVLSGP